MLLDSEKAQLMIYREMGSMSQAQALDYHALLVKESEVVEEVVVAEAEVPKKKRKRK